MIGTECFGKRLSCGFPVTAFVCPCPRVGSFGPCPCWTSNCLLLVQMSALVLFVLWNLVCIGSVMKCCGHGHAEVRWAWLCEYRLNCCSVLVAFDGVLRLGFVRWPWKLMTLVIVERNVYPCFLFCRAGLRRLDSFLLLNHCNDCCPIGVVILVVMLTGYLPENANRAF